ncbi:MAG: hypothetical protein E3J75_01910 [Dehalococcoidia bacterium]|nr:MAG: hypothetical protein E3J75_01910 [Dehalococcoidia bacterium]
MTTNNNIIPVKYVFLDVVAYTKRTIEAQCYIIEALNRIVKGTTNRYHISNDSLIYIPTGDGMCIALLGIDLPYDIHVTIATEILRRVWVNNSRVKYNWRKFEVRIGINQSDDNIVTDVNGRKNVAGAGINNARRIMDLADESQILVSSTVYENLHPRKNYYHAFSKEFTKEVKHGLVLDVYQLVRANIAGLNTNPPSSLVAPPKPEPKLTKLAAYYFAHSLKNREFIIRRRGDGQNNYALVVLLWYLTRDSLGKSESTEVEPYEEWMPETRHNTLDEQFELFMELPFSVCCDLCGLVRDVHIGTDNWKYFEDSWQATIVNVEGRKKLKSDWPEIWDEFQLDEL